MKTFALILHLIFSDGSSQAFVDDTGLTGYDCATRLVEDRDHDPLPREAFKGARAVEQVIMICEEEINS